MTLPEFFGCSMIAFGPPFALFVFTIARKPIRVIMVIMAAFFWLLSLLASSLLWYAVVPLRGVLAFGAVFSVLFQEYFRYLLYLLLRKFEEGLEAVADDRTLVDNKHVLAYVSGFGFGIISAMFSLVNVLADLTGPGTLGLNGGSESFFTVSAAQALSICLLHIFWSVIFFNAFDTTNYIHVSYVVGSHLFVSLITLLNAQQLYAASLTINFIVTVVSGILAFSVAGGTVRSFKRFISCQ
ncbi:gamma-secretase subunit Aph-1-like [Musca domestica]|uniref:Aph-1 protein n=1 Tax=Musca domestica TaxID=7370 RepID=T1PII7_MUSDO|nr:gamma-secretase subunit Aph-1 [Musca domestica]XP_058979815.1 gamma-secretase subunit Aph-1-like [Musca domestica]